MCSGATAAIPIEVNDSDTRFFWSRVKKTDGCWEWMGARSHGYGRIHRKVGVPAISAHRYSFVLHNGNTPSHMEVCHTCDNPGCVRPDHLFAGTRKENAIDAQNKGRLSVPGKGWKRNITHCHNGHEFNEANTYVYKTGQRYCRKCRAVNERNRREKVNADR